MLKQKYFLTGIFILSAERQPIKLAWRKIVWLQKALACILAFQKIANLMKQPRVKVDAHAYGVGFYLFMVAWCLAIPLKA